MRSKKVSLQRAILLMCFIVPLFAPATRAAAQQETILHSFPSTRQDADDPQGGVIFDAAGNIYGTATYGGPVTCAISIGCGAVFELTPAAGGGWTEKILHAFGYGTDGANPYAPVIFDAQGNLYGTTIGGGTGSQGTVFELSPSANGVWSEKILHNFIDDGNDGLGPTTGLTLDAAGNLYGTTLNGGSYGGGTVFELTRSPQGGWTERILHHFHIGTIDGEGPQGALIFDASGNIYGTAFFGGLYSCGTVYELQPSTEGGWTETTLHSFLSSTTDGCQPYAGVVFGPNGVLYGATDLGGAQDGGTVFSLTPTAEGNWAEKVLYSFNYNVKKDGNVPYSGVIVDAAGNLYGACYNDGRNNNGGTVFELIPTADGPWKEKVLLDFSSKINGANPVGGLIFDSAGNIYGTTVHGGADAKSVIGGTVFELTP